MGRRRRRGGPVREPIYLPLPLLGIVAAGLIVLGGLGWYSAARANARARNEHLVALNLSAIADRTERMSAQDHDSLVEVARRQAQQERIQLDASLREKNLVATSLAAIRVEAESLRRNATKAPIL